ncbi:MAG TPA: DUF4214 domain-containing protein, partial [Pirellulales bacterium]|nr:DUF4214 domain-containing protein [Pirellulales bacterium]
SNGTLTANLGTVPIGAVDTITVVVTPTSPGSITNTASVSTTTPNLSTHTTASVQTTINPSTNNEANLSVIKTASPNPDTVGQNLTYVLVVTNTGAAAADNVSVSDTLPSGLTFVSGSTDVNGVTVNDNNGTLTANLGTVAAGVVETVTIVVTPTAPGLVTNTATISTTTPNASTHTSASIQTTINPATSEANVSITKTASANPGTVGQSLTYTIVATNASGAASAAGVTVVDTLPTAIGATVTAMDTTRNINLTDVGGLITDNIGSLAAGASDTITVTVTPTQAGLLTNTASVTTTTPNASNNTTASVQTTINAANNEANVSITKTASANPGTVGQSLTYTIVATNASGAASAAGVTVIDTLPTAIGATVTAVDTTRNVNLTDVAGVITDHIGTLAAGSSDTITVTVTPTQAGTLTNTASVTATTPNVSNQTSAIVNTTINPATSEANLSITKTASPSPGAINQNLTYTIVVTDAAGAASAAGVIVTDTLPTAIGAHVTAVDTTRNVNLNVTGGVITDHIGTLAAGSSDTITVTVTPTQVGTLTNTASVTTTTPNASTQTTATVNTTIASTPAQSFYLNGQPGDASDQTFLTNLYRELFDRNPDASGFQFWLNFLATNGGTTASGQSNASTRNEVVQLFLNSQEYLTHWVDSAFQAFLNRPTDHGSETFFVQQLENGVSEQSVLVTILSSPEYFSHPGPTPGQNGPGNQNGQGNQNNQGNQNENSQASNGSHGPAAGNTNLAFVDNLYVELLGRTADATSEQTWVNALNSGMLTRAQVVQGFLNTPEEAHDLLDAPGSTPGAPGTPATGTYPLAVLTGGGWDNLYFQGNLGTLNASAVDQFMGELESNTAWQTVQDQMLDLPQYFDNNAS